MSLVLAVVTAASVAIGGSAAFAADDRVTITGTVALADGRTPAAGEIAVVVPGVGRVGFTAAGGSFAFSTRAASRYEMVFTNVGTAGSYVKTTYDLWGPAAEALEPVSVTMPVGGVVRGSVLTTSGDPAGGGSVMVERFWAPNSQQWSDWYPEGDSVKLAADGSYEIRNIPDGTVRVRFVEDRMPPLQGEYALLLSKYWTVTPESPLWDSIDVRADVHENMNIVGFRETRVGATVPCPECAESSVRGRLEWYNPQTGAWLRTGHQAYGGFGASAASLLATVPPGAYRFVAASGINLDSGWSGPVSVAEGESATAEFVRTPSALHVRQPNGDLIRYDNNGRGRLAPGVVVARGLGEYTQIVDAGDLTSDGHRDLLALTQSGVLVRLDGKTDGTFSPAVRVASGWSNYTHLIPFGDANRDGNLDILAKGKSGTLFWMAGDGRGALSARTQIGATGAWKPYRAFAFVGDDDLQPALVALSDTGNVYQFHSEMGVLNKRIKMTSGWSTVTQMVGVGPFNSDGTHDIVIRRKDGTVTLQKLMGDEILGPITLGTKWSGRLLI